MAATLEAKVRIRTGVELLAAPGPEGPDILQAIA
jgi:hypothetical protein